MSDREIREQPHSPGAHEDPEPVASAPSFPFDAIMSACGCGPAMKQMAAACCGEPEESTAPASGENRVAGA
jgi:hypothetical protein